MVKNIGEVPDKNTIKTLEKKLDKCRNQDNNPDSEAWVAENIFDYCKALFNCSYKIKMNKLLNDDDDAPGPMEYHLASPDRSDVSMLSTSQFSA